MAFNEGMQPVSGEANIDFSAKQYRFVVTVPGSSTNLSERYTTSGAGGEIHGVSMNDPAAAGRALTVAKRGRCKVEAGETVAAGDWVSSDSVGRAAVIASGEFCGGQAVTGGAVGEIITVELQIERGRF